MLIQDNRSLNILITAYILEKSSLQNNNLTIYKLLFRV